MKVLLVNDDRSFYDRLIRELTASGHWLIPLGPTSPGSTSPAPASTGPTAFTFSPHPENLSWIDILDSTLRTFPEGKAVLCAGGPAPEPAGVNSIEVRWVTGTDPAAKGKGWTAARAAASGGEGPGLAPGFFYLPSAPMQDIYRQLERAADLEDTHVLLYGETGCGKQHLARFVHGACRRRADRPFVEINCAALPEALMESELFGHESGSFTGAHRPKKGLLEAAQGGTVFLDEIGEMPPMLQAKLLKVLEEKRLRRVGGISEIKLEVRFVAATNRPLERDAAEGRFRPDLFYRLNGFSVRVPPLRERPEDVDFLAGRFLRETCLLAGKDLGELDVETLRALRKYAWPGNIRELRAVIRRAVILSEGPGLSLADLTKCLPQDFGGGSRTSGEGSLNRAEWDRLNLVRALRETKGNRTLAAQRLGVSRQTVLNKIRLFNLEDVR